MTVASSIARTNEVNRLRLVLNEVIPGWTQGLQLIGEGGMIELEIPPEIGYGTRGMPGAIPPNARLHFIVELIKVH